MKDFFISYNRHDKQWAEWIAWTLEEAGYTVVIQAWDFRPGGNFVLDMQRAAAECEKTIAVLSAHYLRSEYTQSEWGTAFAGDPQSLKRKLIPMRVGECRPEGVLRTIVYVDLVGVTEALAHDLVLDALQARGKPAQKPGFPGKPSERVTLEHIPFPGYSLPYSSVGNPSEDVNAHAFEDFSQSAYPEEDQLLDEEDLSGGSLGDSVKVFIQKGLDLFETLRSNVFFWAALIGLPICLLGLINFTTNRNKCEERIQEFDTRLNSSTARMRDPEHSFKRGQLQYECRSYLGQEPYIASFKEASTNAKADPKIWQLFIDEATKVRDHVQVNPDPGGSELEYAAFLFEQSTDIQPNNFKSWLELGKTYQYQFQVSLAKPNEIRIRSDFDKSSDFLEKALKFYDLAADKYDGTPNQNDNKIEVLFPKGYGLILKGDFIRDKLIPEGMYSEDDIAKERLEKSKLAYQEAAIFFDLISKKQPNESSIFMGKAVALSRLGLVKEACIEYARAKRMPPTELRNFTSLLAPMFSEVKCSAENTL